LSDPRSRSAFAPARARADANAVIGAPARPPRVALRGPATHPPRPSISSHRTKTTSMSTTYSGTERYSWSKTAKSRGVPPPAALGSVPADASAGTATFTACRTSKISPPARPAPGESGESGESGERCICLRHSIAKPTRARARLASQGTACTRSSARGGFGRGSADLSGGRLARDDAARRRARRRGNEKETSGRGRTRAGVGAPLLHRAERPDVRQGPVQEYRLRGRGWADRSASRTARRRGDGGRLHATERGGAVEAPRMPRLLVGRVGTHVTLESGPQGIVNADLRDTSEGPGSACFGMVPRARPEAGRSRPQPCRTTTCSKIRLHPRHPGEIREIRNAPASCIARRRPRPQPHLSLRIFPWRSPGSDRDRTPVAR
jgi:hypothetical protein